eukprot:1147111-Pelagomonas_calceolata.AAC.1
MQAKGHDDIIPTAECTCMCVLWHTCYCARAPATCPSHSQMERTKRMPVIDILSTACPSLHFKTSV